MTGAQPDGGRDIPDVEALIIDRYLESILAAHGRGADSSPRLAGTDPDSDVRMAAERLARELPRFHPSFRFEEALAATLSEAAGRMRLPLVAGGERDVVPPIGRSALALLPPRADRQAAIGRPLLIGGALTSAALSIAGAAYVAWRRRHPHASPMARAVRARARTRLA